MYSQFEESIEDKNQFVQQKHDTTSGNLFDNQQQQKKHSDKSYEQNNGGEQEKLDMSYRKKTLEYIQKMESQEKGRDKMIEIIKNQNRMLNALKLVIKKNQEQYQRGKDNKTYICTQCQKQKHFTNKYTLQRHVKSKHNNVARQNISLTIDDPQFP